MESDVPILTGVLRGLPEAKVLNRPCALGLKAQLE
jgi:hypothetical protein